MKKIFSSFLLLLCTFLSNAQVATITPVTYRGAFAPAPTAMWTNSWTNWDPQNANYGTGVDSIIKTPITSNRTLSGTKKYLLQGLIYVTNNATLTIQAGCIIKGNADVANTSLIITRGAKINAVGTATKPIVFTSSNDIGSRNKGDWGGIILLGKAHVNIAGGQNYIEGIANSANTQYGGGLNPDDNDNSGTLKYVRIEFGGYIFAPNQEINGLTMGGVGRGTIIDYVQVSFANDDAYEWFGGTVNCKRLVAYRCLDDNWDSDFGFSGSVQFGLGVRDPQISDNPAISTSEGFESDNDPLNTSVGGVTLGGDTTLKPYTSALFCNITDIGPLRGISNRQIASGFRRNARFRRNNHCRVLNNIMLDFPTGVYLDGINTVNNTSRFVLNANTSNPGNFIFKNNLLAGQQSGKVCERNVPTFDIWSWFGTNKNDSLVSTTGILVNPYDSLPNGTWPASATTWDLRPVVNGPATKNYNWNDSAFYYVDTTGNITSLITCPGAVLTPATIAGGKSVVCSYITSGETVKYYLTAKSITGVLNYQWSVPTGVTLVAGQGTDSIWVTFDNTFAGGSISARNVSYCGALSAPRNFAVTKNPPTIPGAISGASVVCGNRGGADVTYQVTAVAGATSYNWSVTGGATITSTLPYTRIITVSFPLNYVSGSLTVRSVNECGESTVRTLLLKTIPSNPTTLTGPLFSCPDLGTPVTYSTTPVVGASSYLWTVPVGATINGSATGSSISVTYANAESGLVTVKSRTGCGTNPVAKTLAINKNQIANPTGIDGDLVVCPNDVKTYTVVDVNNGAGTVYNWIVNPPGASFTGQGTASIEVTYLTDVAGDISVTATKCDTTSASATITISQGSCFAKANRAINGELSETVSNIYPNPAHNQFTVTVKGNENASTTVSIVNTFGQAVSQKVVSAQKGNINVQFSDLNLPAGIYYVKYNVGTKTVVKKVVIK